MQKRLEHDLRVLLLVDLELLIPPNKEMGDFAFACFKLGSNPVEAAEDFSKKINNANLELIEKAVVEGAYVNLFLKTPIAAKEILKTIKEKGINYGSQDLGKDKDILIEFPSQNTHKEFHVGHLRNVCIGSSIAKLYEKMGYKVHLVNYLNDFGAHVAKCLWGVINLSDRENIGEDKQEWLGKIYAEATRAIEQDEHKKQEAQEIQKKLEQGEDEYLKEIFEKTRNWSIEGFDKIHTELGLKHEKVFFESDIKDKGQQIVSELADKKIAETGEGGAIIVNLESKGLDVALLRKSNGTGLYITSDLALAEEKKKFYSNIEESINITGIEQIFYFKQLFEILKLNGFDYKMTHIGYGLVNLPSGKMSSRKGNVILYKYVFSEVFDKMLFETKSRRPELDEDVARDVAKKLTLGAIKFSLLKHESNKNIIFDILEATAISGYTGLYILYTIARLNSLIKQAPKVESGGEKLEKQEEKNVLIMLSKYDDVCQKAWGNKNPSVITRYAFDLANSFNEFYSKHRILDAEGVDVVLSRVALCEAVRLVLEDSMKLLSIDTLVEM